MILVIFMECEVLEYFNKTIHYINNNLFIGSYSDKLYLSYDKGKTWHLIAKIQHKRNKTKTFFLDINLIRRLLRRDIRAFLLVKFETNRKGFIFFFRGKSYYYDLLENKLIELFPPIKGSGPLVNGCCKDKEGNCFYGEYWGNKKRREVCIYKLDLKKMEWMPFYKYNAGKIRHVHSLQYDSYTEQLWVTTGDSYDECSIGYFYKENDVPIYREVVKGGVEARAVSLIFTQEYVYWGSDGGRDVKVKGNWIYRFNRSSESIDKICMVGGPVYYSYIDKDGRMYFTTGIEGSCSEINNEASIWASKDGENWYKIYSLRKDNWPMIFGYGIFSFPHIENVESEVLYINTWGLDSDYPARKLKVYI